MFVDTSALLAFLDAGQPHHREVLEAFDNALDEEVVLFTSSYVLVETSALVQRRLGLDAVRALFSRLVPLIEVLWIDQEIHEAAVGALFAAGRRQLSLVDCTSFELMRRMGLETALALDRDFTRHGFEIRPRRT